MQRTIILFAALFFIGISASIHFSTIHLGFATQVYGSKTVWLGQQAAFYLRAYDAKSLRPIPAQKVQWEITDATGIVTQHTSKHLNALTAVHLQIPTQLLPPVDLHITVHAADGHDSLQIPLSPATISALRNQSDPNRLPRWAPVEIRDGPWLLRFSPAGGRLVWGMRNTLYAELLFKNQASSSLHINEIRPQKQPFHNLREGVFTWGLNSRLRQPHYTFALDDPRKTQLQHQFTLFPLQLSLQEEPTPSVMAGDQHIVTIHSLQRSTQVQADLWFGQAFIESQSLTSHQGQVKIPLSIPSDATGLMHLNVYRNIDDVSATLVQQPIWTFPPGQRNQLSLLQRLDISRYRFDGPHTYAPLRDTGDIRQAQVSSLRQRLRLYTHRYLLIIILLSATVFLAWLATQKHVGMSKHRWFLLIAILLSLILFGWGLWILSSRWLHWT